MTKKILIADDEIFIRALLAQTLEDFKKSNVEILLAHNGQKAWETIQAEHPDLIILDVMMPKLSGYEVCQRVKSTPAYFNSYVIMLTARGQDVDRQRSTQVGVNEYITKPFDPDRLIALAAEVLDIKM